MKVSVTTTRTGNPQAVLKALKGLVVRNATEAVTKCAELLKEESVSLAPEDTGSLKLSAYVDEQVLVEPTRVSKKFGFGKHGERWIRRDKKGVIRIRHPFDYAVRVHEGISPQFDFISRAIQSRTQDLAAIVKEIMKRK